MSIKHGISIILADSHDEVNAIMKKLKIEESFRLQSLEQMFVVDPNAVYYVVLPSKEAMTTLAGYLNIKRGVMSYAGHREVLGCDMNWTVDILLNSKTAELRYSTRGEVAQEPLGFIIPEDREDPFEDLGYRRR